MNAALVPESVLLFSTYKEFKDYQLQIYDAIKEECSRRKMDKCIIVVSGVFVEPTTVSERKICL